MKHKQTSGLVFAFGVCVCVCVPGVGKVVKALPDLQHVFAGKQSFLWTSTHGLQLHLGVQQTATHDRTFSSLCVCALK